MLIYIIVFFIVILLSVSLQKQSNKAKSNILIITIIFILSFLGAVRTSNIGTDILVYGERWFEYAGKYDSFSTYVSVINSTETGYLLLNYIVAIFTDNFNIFLFVQQAICNALVIVTLYRYKDKVPLWLSVLMYLCVYYLRTYNYLRQAIALSILFFGIKYMEEKKILKYLVTVIVAMQFHFTAFVGTIIYLIYAIFNSNLKYKGVLTFLLILVSSVVLINISHILKMLYSLNMINYRLYNYTIIYLKDEFDFSFYETMFKISFILIYLMNIKTINKKESINYVLGIYLLIDFISFQIRGMISYADRVSLYFGYYTMLLIPQIPDSFTIGSNKKIIKVVLPMLLIGFWLFKFVFENSGEVYPYTSILF